MKSTGIFLILIGIALIGISIMGNIILSNSTNQNNLSEDTHQITNKMKKQVEIERTTIDNANNLKNENIEKKHLYSFIPKTEDNDEIIVKFNNCKLTKEENELKLFLEFSKKNGNKFRELLMFGRSYIYDKTNDKIINAEASTSSSIGDAMIGEDVFVFFLGDIYHLNEINFSNNYDLIISEGWNNKFPNSNISNFLKTEKNLVVIKEGLKKCNPN
jgi:hypothetical protein